MSLDTLPVPSERRTASDEVADTLRDAIISGQFADGEQLNQVELAKHFGVSRVPVREALRRLQAEGLVGAEAHRKVIVLGLNRERISEIFEIRERLEIYMLERASFDAEAIERLRATCDAMDRAKGHEAWLQINHSFHQQLLTPSEATVTLSIVKRLSAQVERYLRRTGGVRRAEEAGREHREIVAALERHAPSQAAKVLSRHILGTRDQVLAALPLDPDPDADAAA